jgi:hypothetical protein
MGQRSNEEGMMAKSGDELFRNLQLRWKFANVASWDLTPLPLGPDASTVALQDLTPVPLHIAKYR